ncbi:MAG: carbamoyl-phosphate synthase large subunit [Candidatus Bipolaricaulia bacterium]
MPKRPDVNKVLLVGSGPIQIGQAAEFDYSGSQACRGLREEGVEVALVNSNPATIMTDPEMADSVYIEPLTVEVLETVIEKERPDGIAAGLGGQTGLNLTAELDEQGILDDYGVEVLGTPVKTIHDSEDRAKFKDMMESVGEEVAESSAVNSLSGAKKAAEEIGLPVVVRPAYTLGGAGGGLAKTEEEFEKIVSRGLELSRINQVLIEESVEGWKEFEYEVMRDANDTCITVVNMENMDPMGIHTGESMVVAPSQTISDLEHQQLRSAAIKIIRTLGVEGGCNIQFALNPETGDYKVVEVNPRVSRSSALASKATGYPIARVAAKIAVGLNLVEIPNEVTDETPASFEPTVDYTVVKIPKWPFEKFRRVDRELTTQMKSTGEVMAIGRNLEEAIHKAIRSLDIGKDGLGPANRQEFESREEIVKHLKRPTDRRKFAIYDALRSGMSVEEVSDHSLIDQFWIRKFQKIVRIEEGLQENWKEYLAQAKLTGFSDAQVADIAGVETEVVEEEREDTVNLDYKVVDTCAGEFKARTPYYYSTYKRSNVLCTGDDSKRTESGKNKKVLILGAGPIRIGQGIEFDYGCVHALEGLKEEGIETLMLNNNPETVSTDYDTSDKLFFDPLTLEDVMNVVKKEDPDGIIVQFGGQTSVNIAQPLGDELAKKEDLKTEIYGTDPEMMDVAEDRDRFSNLLTDLDISQPDNGMASSLDQAKSLAEEIGFPVLVRPSYVLGGREMEIVYSESELSRYLGDSFGEGNDDAVLIDRFLENSVEIDVDAVSDGEQVLVGGIMEHIEHAGVHSGDSACVVPPQSVSHQTITKIERYTKELARSLNVVGLLNIQMAVKGDEIFLLEANPRSSRTVPYLSKATGTPLAKIAAKVMVGKGLNEIDYSERTSGMVAVKEVVSPFGNLPGVDPLLGPEMQSTGEVMGIAESFDEAYYKAELAAENELPGRGTVLLSLKDGDKSDSVLIAKELEEAGLELLGTEGTADYLRGEGVAISKINKVSQGSPSILDEIDNIDLIINTPTQGEQPHRDGFKIRRAAVDLKIPYITNLQAAHAAVRAIKRASVNSLPVRTIEEYQPQ